MDYGVFLSVASIYEGSRTGVIKKLKKEDKDPDRPADEQEWGLYTSDGSKLLGRHPSKEKALEQERAIKSKGGSVFEEISKKYSQSVDPTQLQVGESVYDDTDKEYRVVENDPNTTDVVLMPADQAQQMMPEGVTTVDETEIGSYTVQPTGAQTVARRTAGEVDWDDIQSAALDILTLSRRQELYGLIEAMDYLNSLLLDQVEVPEDTDLSSMFASAHKKKSDDILAEFDKDIDMEVMDSEDLSEFSPGESGYTEIMKDIKSMIADEVPVVDLILAIGEKYPRSMGEKVLADARSRGIL